MSTALASQLSGLRSLNAARLSTSAAVRHAHAPTSYLFSSRDAARQDLRTVHAIAVNGWEELPKDSSDKSELLFGATSLTRDRTTLTKEENAEIDVAVAAWFAKFGGFLLEASASKCIEWLVRRFRIHEFNAHTFLSAFVPYHATPQFARVVQICELSKAPLLASILQPHKSAASGISLETLLDPVVHAPNAGALLRWLVSLVGSDPPHRALLAFWTSALVHVCVLAAERPAEYQTSVVGAILPAAAALAARSSGLTKRKQSDAGEALTAACMLLCALATSLELSPDAVTATLSQILPSQPGAGATRPLLAACYALTARLPRGSLPPAQLRALLALPRLQATIEQDLHRAQFDIRPFLEHLTDALVANLGTAPSAEALLQSILLARGAPHSLRLEATQKLIALRGASSDARTRVLVEVRQRAPELFERALHQYTSLGGNGSAAHAAALLQELITESTLAKLPAASQDGDRALWLAVHSASASERAVALRKLLQDTKLDSEEERQAMRGILLARLSDDHADIVQAIYAAQHKKAPTLLQVVDVQEVLEAVLASLDAISAAPPAAAAELVQAHLAFFLAHIWSRIESNVAARSLERAVLSTGAYTRTTASLAKGLYRAIAAAPAAKNSPLLAGLQDACKRLVKADDDSLAANANAHIAAALAAHASAESASVLLARAERLRTTYSPSDALAALVLAHSAQARQSAVAPDSAQQQILHLARVLFDSSAPVLSAGYLQAAAAKLDQRSLLALALLESQLPAHADAASLSQKLFLGDKSSAAVSADASYRAITALPSTQHAHALLAQWLARLRQAALPRLAQMWTDSTAAPTSRVQALVHARALMQACDATDLQTLLPAVLVALADGEQQIRRAAIGCLQAMQSAQGKNTDKTVFAFDTIYGAASATLQYLQTSDVKTLLVALLGETDAFARDSAHLEAFCAARLATVKGEGRKEVAFKTAVLCWLLSHVACWENAPVRAVLLQSLRGVRSAQKLPILLAPLKALAARDHLEADEQECARLLFDAYDRSARGHLDAASDAWRFLLASLRSSTLCSPACSAVQVVFASVSVEQRLEALRTLAAQVALSHDASHAALSACVRQLPLDASLLAPTLAHFREAGARSSADAHQSKKARRTDDAAVDAAASFQSLAFLLDVAHGRKVTLTAALVAELFEDIKTILDQRSHGAFNAELALEHVLGILRTRLTADPEVMQSLRVDALASIIKLPLSRSLMHAVLQLMAKIAQHAPEQVVHNVMPILTFVGSSVLARDDQASFAIVELTIRDIVPALISKIRSELTDGDHFALVLRCRDFLRIFAGAAHHMPSHRRYSIFKLLVDVLGPADFLAPVLLLLVDRHTNKIVKSDRRDVLELPLSIFAQYPRATQSKAIEQCMQEADRLIAIGQADPVSAAASVFLDRIADTHAEHAPALQDGTKQAAAVLAFVARALEASHVAQGTLTSAGRKALAYADSQAEHVRKVGQTLLTSSMSAMDPPSCIAFLLGLFAQDKTFSRAVDLLLARLDDDTAGDLDAVAKHLGELLPSLLEQSEAPPVARLLELLSEFSTPQDEVIWASAVPKLVRLIQQGRGPADAFLSTLSNLVLKLGPRLIPQLAQLVAVCQGVLTRDCSDADMQASIRLLSRLSKAVPTFMASHLQTLVRLNTDLTVSGRGAAQPLAASLNRSYQPEQVLAAISSQWDAVSGTQAFVALLDLLRRVLSQADRTATAKIYKSVFRLILKAFDLRRTAADHVDFDQTEAACNRVFIQMILKLNENTFRPLFLRLYDWAVVDLVDDGTALRHAGVRARALTFYRFLSALQNQLKALVTGYYSITLDFTLESLTVLASRQVEDVPLRAELVATLARSAQYDEGTFWNTARAARAAPVLVQGLDLAATVGIESVAEDTASALCAMAKVVPEDGLLKTINRELLSKARAPQEEAALAALLVLDTFWSSVGEDLLPLVPETAPFLSELLAIPNQEIVEHTQDLVHSIERVLGEPLDQYLA